MSARQGTFAKYPNRIFIETGSYKGDGIQQALDEGFPMVISIELSPELFVRCFNRFDGDDRVTCFLGDTAEILPKILETIDEPCTFWLDAHYSGGETAKGKTLSPVVEELKAIGQHHIKTHTILIDDMRDWELYGYGITADSAKAMLKEINKDYRFILEDGYVPNDILIATP